MKTWNDFANEVEEEAIDTLTGVEADTYLDEHAKEVADSLIDDETEEFELMLEDEEFANNDEILEFLQEQIDNQEDRVSDAMFNSIDKNDCPVYLDDFKNSFTGNDSGSRTCNAYESRENIKELIWDDTTVDTFKDAGYEGIPMEKGPEAIEVIAYWLALNEREDDIASSWLDSVEDEVRRLVEKHDQELLAKYQKLTD